MNKSIPDKPMEEPSVLDFLKARVKFWRSETIHLPPSEPPEKKSPKQKGEEGPSSPFPWKTLLGLILALIGQRLFEPTFHAGLLGSGFYLIAAGFIIWAYLQGELTLSQGPNPEYHPDPLTFRWIPMVLSFVFALLAFIFLGNNLFTKWNVTLWIAAVACFIWALWLNEKGKVPWWRRAWDVIKQRDWNLKVTPWMLLILSGTILVVFFRVYHLNQTPAEPFSDHAEKILDVYDITQGKTSIFFTRNTGREGMQMYLTVLVSWLFGTGLSFLSLKIGTVICGLLTLPFMYSLGREVGGKRVGFLAMLFTGIAYWPNVISRVGLRFPLYPLFVAITLLYLLRGLRTQNRNDFLLSGLFLGLGLHGYSPFRIVPIAVGLAIVLFLIHPQTREKRSQVLIWLSLLILGAVLVFLPLLRYAVENPAMFSYRAFTRLDVAGSPLDKPWYQILFSNLWNAARMFNWDDGEIWVHSVTHRPALDVVSGALFLIGVLLVFLRYIRQRNWSDLFLLLSIPVFQLPSSLAIAFPNENPALNRAAGAYIPVFLLVALALDGIWRGLNSGKYRRYISWALTGLLLIWSGTQNYDLVFRQYDQQYRMASINSSEMGAVIKQFEQTYGTTDSVWIVPFPYWVDTRLPGVWAGIPNRDFAIKRGEIPSTMNIPSPKLFIVKADITNPDYNDQASLDLLEQVYPQGSAGLYSSKIPSHEFWIYFVP